MGIGVYRDWKGLLCTQICNVLVGQPGRESAYIEGDSGPRGVPFQNGRIAA